MVESVFAASPSGMVKTRCSKPGSTDVGIPSWVTTAARRGCRAVSER